MHAGPEDTAELDGGDPPRPARRACDRLDLLADQRSFYRARAPEYDQWWQRTGRYDHGPNDAAEWDRQVRQAVQAVDDFGALGDVLELAGGTGWWSRHLAQTATTLTVVDSSEETLRINSARVGQVQAGTSRFIYGSVTPGSQNH